MERGKRGGACEGLKSVWSDSEAATANRLIVNRTYLENEGGKAENISVLRQGIYGFDTFYFAVSRTSFYGTGADWALGFVVRKEVDSGVWGFVMRKKLLVIFTRGSFGAGVSMFWRGLVRPCGGGSRG